MWRGAVKVRQVLVGNGHTGITSERLMVTVWPSMWRVGRRGASACAVQVRVVAVAIQSNQQSRPRWYGEFTTSSSNHHGLSSQPVKHRLPIHGHVIVNETIFSPEFMSRRRAGSVVIQIYVSGICMALVLLRYHPDGVNDRPGNAAV